MIRVEGRKEGDKPVNQFDWLDDGSDVHVRVKVFNFPLFYVIRLFILINKKQKKKYLLFSK